ncbi:MAG: bifunctional 4-hydroxy-2-oxoglutarate aldolase/2-dehydro-3-deoxy-phosphogluconate aldolase [Anaerolineae bacterium]|nr:bifunctional 4-hydroxy-2-oxoglutarate aldolase/2-dehydro-3-deoxy-phosphogluconate aldolase [Anaerolineae bacterium]
MQPQFAYDLTVETGLMAGMRGNFPPEISLPIAETLLKSGIKSFEFTLNSVKAIEAMQATKRAFGDAAAVGMGTVLKADDARKVLDAGADFVVAPSFQRDTVTLVHTAGVLMVPGVITPTEAVDAHQMGAKLIKIFPIGALGVDYFKAVRAPLDQIPFCCNGGMSDQNVGDFIRAGAVACGMANWLTGDGTWPLSKIADRAQLLLDIVSAAREGKSPAAKV